MRSLEKQPVRWCFSQSAAPSLVLVTLLSLLSLSLSLPTFGPLHIGHVEVSSNPARLYAAAPASTSKLSITWRFPASARGVALQSGDDVALTFPDALSSAENPLECSLKWDDTAIPTTQTTTSESGDTSLVLNIGSQAGPWSVAPSDTTASDEASAFISLTCDGQYPAQYMPPQTIEPRVIHDSNRITSLQGALFLPPIRGPFASQPTMSLFPGYAGLAGSLRISFNLSPDSAFMSLYPLGPKSMVYALLPDPSSWSFGTATPKCAVTVGSAREAEGVSVVLSKLPALIFNFTAPIATASGATAASVVIDCPDVTATTSAVGYPRRVIEMGIADEKFASLHAVSDAVRDAVRPTPAMGSKNAEVFTPSLVMGSESQLRVVIDPVATASSSSAPTTVLLTIPPGYKLAEGAQCQILLTTGEESEQVNVPAAAWTQVARTFSFKLAETVVFTRESSLAMSCPSTSFTTAPYHNDDNTGRLSFLMTPDSQTTWFPVASTRLDFPLLTPKIGVVPVSDFTVVFTTGAEPGSGEVLPLVATIPIPEQANQKDFNFKLHVPCSEFISTACSFSTLDKITGTFAAVGAGALSTLAITHSAATQMTEISFDIVNSLTFGSAKFGVLRIECPSVRARTIGVIAGDVARYELRDSAPRTLAMLSIPAQKTKEGDLAPVDDAVSITEDALAGFRSTVSFAVQSTDVLLDQSVAVLISLHDKFDLTLNTGGVQCSIDGALRPVRVLDPTAMLVLLYSESPRSLNVVVRIVCSLVLPAKPPAATDDKTAFLLFRAPPPSEWETVGIETLLMLGTGTAHAFPSYPVLTEGTRGSKTRDYSLTLPYTGTMGGAVLSIEPFDASLSVSTEYLTFTLPAGMRVPPNGGRCFFYYDEMSAGDVDERAVTISRLPASNDRLIRVEPADSGNYKIDKVASLACDVILSEEPTSRKQDAGFTLFENRQGSTTTALYGSGVPALTPAPLGFTTATPAKPLPGANDVDDLAVAVELIRDAGGPADFTYGVRGAALKVTVAHPNIDLDEGDVVTFDLPAEAFRGSAADLDAGDVSCRWEGLTTSVSPDEPYARVAVKDQTDLFDVTSFTLSLPSAVRRSGSISVTCSRSSFFLLSSVLLIDSPNLAMEVRRASSVRPGILAGEARNLRLRQPVPALSGETLTAKSIETPGGPEGLGEVIVTVKALAPVLELPKDSAFIFSIPGRFKTTDEASVKTTCALYLNELPTTPEPTEEDPDPAPSTQPLMESVATHEHVGGTSIDEPAETIMTVLVTKPVKSKAAADNYVLLCKNVVYGEREEEDKKRHIELRAASGYRLISTDEGEYSGVTGARLTLYVTHTMTIRRSTPLTSAQVNSAVAVYTSRLKDITFTASLVRNVIDKDINALSFAVALLMTGSTSHEMLTDALKANRGSIENSIATLANARVATLKLGDVNYPPTCFNGVRDADEADLDCGATCFACPDRSKCFGNADCRTGYCHQRRCVSSRPNSAQGRAGAVVGLVAALLLSVMFLG